MPRIDPYTPREHQLSYARAVKITSNDDMIEAWLGVGTQLNALGHIGVDDVYCGGRHAADFVTNAGTCR